MSYEKVAQEKNIVVGTKQTIKALEKGNVAEVIIAQDADLRVIQKVKAIAEKNNIPISTVPSMKKLGKACGIQVGAAAVGISK